MRGEAGYTLLELLVVLALMGLILAAVPGMALGVVDSARFSARAQQVAYRLEAAHARALASGRTVSLNMAGFAGVSSGARRVDFFADGSSSGGDVFVGGWGRARVIRIDPMTGVITAPVR